MKNPPLPPRRPSDLSASSEGLPEIKYGYASEILPHIQAALGNIFGGSEQPSLTPEQLAANNSIWARLSQGKSASPSGMGPEMPQARKQAVHASPAFDNPFLAYSMPTQMTAPQTLAQMYPVNQATPQPMVAGLLGGQNENSMRSFLDAELYGRKPSPQPVATVGGSATPISNPFLYAQLYGRGRG